MTVNFAGRVTLKSQTRYTMDGRVPYFYMYINNGTEQRRAFAVGDAYNAFFNKIEIGKSYRFNNLVEDSGKRPDEEPIKDLRLQLYWCGNEPTTVVECEDIEPGVIEAYNFVPLGEIKNLNEHVVVTVIGICSAVEVKEGENFYAKEVTLVDESCPDGVVLTLFDRKDNIWMDSIVLMEAAYVKIFNDRKGLTNNGLLIEDPDIPRSNELVQWKCNAGN